MIEFPTFPKVPVEQRGTGPARSRYEDFTQDGRLTLQGITQMTGPMVWESLLAQHLPWRAMREQGIYPILSRMLIEGYPGSPGFARSLSWTGGYQLAHAGSAEAVLRLMLNMWVDVNEEPRARPEGSPSPAGGESVPRGRFFAEHVFTRPLAAPEQRKVLRFNVPGLPEIPGDRHTSRPCDEIIALPADAAQLEPAPASDVLPIVFGICHTDNNQHINSLVYPRLFEEAAIRRLAYLGVSTPVLGRFMEIGYRKPCFAGDRVRIVLQAFTLGERWGATGVFIPEGDVAAPERARPHCYVQMLFER
jgi:hypothetical protein